MINILTPGRTVKNGNKIHQISIIFILLYITVKKGLQGHFSETVK